MWSIEVPLPSLLGAVWNATVTKQKQQAIQVFVSGQDTEPRIACAPNLFPFTSAKVPGLGDVD